MGPELRAQIAERAETLKVEFGAVPVAQAVAPQASGPGGGAPPGEGVPKL